MQMALEQYLIGENGSADSVTFHEALQTQHDPYLQRFVLDTSLPIISFIHEFYLSLSFF